MSTPEQLQHPAALRNRRLSRRLRAQHGIKAACRRGRMELGKDLTLAVLDVSADGVRLLVREPLQEKEEVSLTLTSISHLRPLKMMGSVAWVVASADGAFCVGVRLHKRLTHADLTRLLRP
jgi:hypothetical protein